MPSTSFTSGLSGWLNRIWHLPDGFRWMEPLPLVHRRGIIISLLVILLAFLWPSSSPPRPASSTLSEQSQPGAEKEVPLQAEIIDNTAGNSTPPRDTQGQWRSYTIASGQTLAQLFRDHNLPVNDVFAMAQAEGSDKPLSNLQAGQVIKIRQNANGVINGLTLTTERGDILFTRQPDGSFIRAQ